MYERHIIKTGSQIRCKWRDVRKVWVKPGVWVMALERCVECGEESVSVYHHLSASALALSAYIVDPGIEYRWVQRDLFDNEQA